MQLHHGRITLQGFGPNTIYVKITKLWSSYNLPNTKDKTLVYLSKKNLSSGARLRNGKVLGTHFTQIESGLLDSNDHYIPFCMTLNNML